MAGGLFHVSEGHPGVEGGGNEGVAEGVRSDRLGDPSSPGDPADDPGGAMAVEDAAILSRCLATFDDPATAFRSYTSTRISRVGEVQKISLANTWMGGPTDTDWFYCYDACTAPLTAPH